MQFWFSYPMSETQSYYLLQDCLVALYYQLYFMSKQCLSSRIYGEGWGYCKYGDQVECDQISGWKCSLGDKSKHGNGSSGDSNKCGTNGKASPLQAFLTDCLKGFACPVLVDGESGSGKEYQDKLKQLRSSSDNKNKIYSDCYPEFLSHRGHTSKIFGTECAVPMGFSGSFREKKEGGTPGPKDGMIGLGMHAVLAYYSNDDVYSSGLYQVTRCISSLTRRVPRSTGTLYGFFYGLVDVYSGNKGNFKTQLEGELSCCPGWRNPECLMEALFNWRGQTHTPDREGSHSNGTLDSLYASGWHCNEAKASCGYYLNPLTGSLYNSVATQYCDTYISWIVHLTFVFKRGLESLLEAFKGIQCTPETCKGKDGKTTCECPERGCTKGTHDKCHCEYIVFCGGVLGLFYRFGFTFNNPGGLMYSGSNWERKCSTFYQQLETVINGNLFTDLLAQIRAFLYTTRLPFTLVIFGFWSIVIVYLLWSITGPLDLLHIQSHWRSPRSYLVPLQRILADGSRKGFCTIGYFQENTGDRLLSQGVSDVYL